MEAMKEWFCQSSGCGLVNAQGECLYDACTNAQSECLSEHQISKYQKQIASAVDQVNGHDCLWPSMLMKCHFGSYAIIKQIKPELIPLQHCIALHCKLSI